MKANELFIISASAVLPSGEIHTYVFDMFYSSVTSAQNQISKWQKNEPEDFRQYNVHRCAMNSQDGRPLWLMDEL